MFSKILTNLQFKYFATKEFNPLYKVVVLVVINVAAIYKTFKTKFLNLLILETNMYVVQYYKVFKQIYYAP